VPPAVAFSEIIRSLIQPKLVKMRNGVKVKNGKKTATRATGGHINPEQGKE